ncbi:nucleotidyltransferase family protein [Cytobacillus luteolus]|uniref:nucleotidyltransferase family protein n=1 Tax=Litchfieldia luteola TaxID=682179 RepID=UPI002D7FFC51|nr:nucleotidyltransferase family protein [Cytobacillus luteolus]
MDELQRELIEEQLKASKKVLQEQYGIEKIGIFGSFARNEHHENSDLDILIEVGKPIGLEFFDIKYYLEEKLGVSVDLVTINGLKPQLRDRILEEVIFQ